VKPKAVNLSRLLDYVSLYKIISLKRYIMQAFDKCNKFYARIRKSPKKAEENSEKKLLIIRFLTKVRSIAESVIRSLKVRTTALRNRHHYMKKREFA